MFTDRLESTKKTGGNDLGLTMRRPSKAATEMLIKTVLLWLGFWTEMSGANSAIASFRVNISDSDLLPFMAPGEAIDGSGLSCPNDDDTFSIPDPGWPDQSNGIVKSPVRQRYSQSNYLISSRESICDDHLPPNIWIYSSIYIIQERETVVGIATERKQHLKQLLIDWFWLYCVLLSRCWTSVVLWWSPRFLLSTWQPILGEIF